MADIPKAELANLDDLKDYLPRSEPGDDAILQPLLDMLEGLLEDETGQLFTVGAAIIDDPHDGKGTSILSLNRPPVTVDAAIKVGQILASPDATIPAADIIVDQAEMRLIYKGAAIFTEGIRNIFVTWTAADNLPSLAKAAILEATAFIYHRRGGEHVRGRSEGELGSIQLISSQLRFLPIWQKARGSLKRYSFI